MNRDWTSNACPNHKALFHAKIFLVPAVRYAKPLYHAPQMLPSGWAAVLYLYKIR